MANSPHIIIDVIGAIMNFAQRPCMKKLKKYYKGDNIEARDIYIEAGGEISDYYNRHYSSCANNSCALRVSLALAKSRSAVDLNQGRRLKMGEVHFKKDKNGQYSILEADPLRKYITRLWGEADYKFVNYINPLSDKFEERIQTPDWFLSMRGKCGVIFYMDPKENKATHTGLLDRGQPYRDKYGSTKRSAYIWLVPCKCIKEDQCELCKEQDIFNRSPFIITGPPIPPIRF